MTFISVNIAWIFFRVDEVDKAFSFLHAMVDIGSFSYPYNHTVARLLPDLEFTTNFLVSSNDILRISAFFVCSVAYYSTEDWITRKFKPSIMMAVILACGFVFFVSQLNKLTTFLYFQF